MRMSSNTPWFPGPDDEQSEAFAAFMLLSVPFLLFVAPLWVAHLH